MTIYVIGAGVIGLSLAAHLANAGKQVVLVHSSTQDVLRSAVTIRIRDLNQGEISARVDAVSLAKLGDIDGTIAVSAKAYANTFIAGQLKANKSRIPIVVLQNGIGVEEPFRQAGFSEICRCVLYSGGQKTGAYETNFKSIGSSPIGLIEGSEQTLDLCVDQLSTPHFSFHAECGIQAEIWKKGIINAVFNTICSLLETDNGVFFRDSRAAALAVDVIAEGVAVARALGIDLDEEELMDVLLTISEGSEGQLVSTLQDIQRQSETEIDSLNLEIARIAETLNPRVDVGNTKLLGELVRIKASMIGHA